MVTTLIVLLSLSVLILTLRLFQVSLRVRLDEPTTRRPPPPQGSMPPLAAIGGGSDNADRVMNDLQRTLDQRYAAAGQQLDQQMEQTFAEMDQTFAQMDARFSQLFGPREGGPAGTPGGFSVRVTRTTPSVAEMLAQARRTLGDPQQPPPTPPPEPPVEHRRRIDL